MARTLLVVTEDGYGKRVPLDDVARRHRNKKGVAVSSVTAAAVITLNSTDGDLVLATGKGKVERVAVSSIPTRRRVRVKGRLSKGVRVVTLARGDWVAAVMLSVAPTPEKTALSRQETLDWTWGQAGLKKCERWGQQAVLYPALPLEGIAPGGRPSVTRAQWARTEVHNTSTYSCFHCSRQYADPDDVYACIDNHVAQDATEHGKAPDTYPVAVQGSVAA